MSRMNTIRVGDIQCPIVYPEHSMHRCLACGTGTYCHEHIGMHYNIYMDARCPIVMPSKVSEKKGVKKDDKRAQSNSRRSSSLDENEQWQYDGDNVYDWTPLPAHAMTRLNYDVMTH